MSIVRAIERAAIAFEEENIRPELCVALSNMEFFSLEHELGPLCIYTVSKLSQSYQDRAIKMQLGNVDVVVTRDPSR